MPLTADSEAESNVSLTERCFVSNELGIYWPREASEGF